MVSPRYRPLPKKKKKRLGKREKENSERINSYQCQSMFLFNECTDDAFFNGNISITQLTCVRFNSQINCTTGPPECN